MDLTSNVIINLTANDTTPDVTHIDVGKTANTQTTQYTYFDGSFHTDGKTGRWFELYINDNYSSIIHDTTKIKLIGGISLSLNTGDRILFWLNPANSVWEERNRNIY